MKIHKPLIIVIALALAGGLALSFGHKASVRMIGPAVKEKVKALYFDCVTFDTTRVIIKTSDCGANNGAVVGLAAANVVGTAVFTWYNSLGAIIATGADLNNVSPGTYRVSLRDDSKCPAISLIYYVFENNPVNIDLASAVITPPACNAVNGSITNIKITSATSFTWTDENSKIIATTKDLTNVAPGTYILTASNNAGCISQARFTVNAGANAPKVTSYYYTTSDCGSLGEFHAVFDIKPEELLYNWNILDASGKSYFTGNLAYSPASPAKIDIPGNPGAPYPPQFQTANGGPYPPGYTPTGLPPGTYTLRTFGNGCITDLLTFTITETKLYIDTSKIHVNKNVCGIHIGSITGLVVKGGAPAINTKFSNDLAQGWFWVNDKGERVGTDGFLHDVPSGWYTVTLINYNHCVSPPLRFFLPDSVAQAQVPAVNDVKMCLPGIASLDVKNKDLKAHYRLYDSTQTLIDTSTAGYFARKVDVTTTFYIVSVNGICESPPVKVTATVVNPGVSIPNAFTPNNDGINDYWDVTGLNHYPGTEVTVFNRNGQQVYHSINYGTPFNGQYKGKELPVGVYYYIIDTKKPDCRGGVSGSLTIIR